MSHLTEKENVGLGRSSIRHNMTLRMSKTRSSITQTLMKYLAMATESDQILTWILRFLLGVFFVTIYSLLFF